MKTMVRLIVSVGLVSAMALTLVPQPAHADPVSDEAGFLAKLNSLRASKGLRPLGVHPVLTGMARNWSSRMAAAGNIWHNPNMAAQAPSNWARLGENVGMGSTVDSLHNAFVASPAHYANIVNIHYDSVGVGVVQSGTTKFVTFNFMATQGAPPASTAPSQPAADGRVTFTPVTPARVLDTRNGTGQGGRVAKVGPGHALVVDVTGAGGVPASGVTAVTINVTATEASAGSFLSVTPAGGNTTSNLNFPPGRDIPNLVTVPVGADGNVRIYNNSGSTHVVADVSGWYGAAGGARYNPVTPARILDTRNGTGQGGRVDKAGPGQTITLDVTGPGGVPASGVSAVTMNVTATEASAGSFLSVTPSGGRATSNLNFTPGRDVPNLVTVPVGPDGNVRIYNNSGSTHVVADVAGWYTAPGASTGALYNPVTPARVVDTRTGTGTAGARTPVGPGQTLIADVTGVGGVPASGVAAVVVNVTVTQPSAHSFLSITPNGGSSTSNLNFVAGQDVPNLVVVPVGTDGNVRAYNNSGSTHVIFDVTGWFSA